MCAEKRSKNIDISRYNYCRNVQNRNEKGRKKAAVNGNENNRIIPSHHTKN